MMMFLTEIIEDIGREWRFLGTQFRELLVGVSNVSLLYIMGVALRQEE